MAEEPFKLPRSSYEELIKIIQSYATSSTEMSLDEVAQTAMIDSTIISGNNACLSALGIIQGGRAKAITPKGRELAHAIQSEMPNEIREHWREIVNSNSFLQKILSAVRIRKGMDYSTLQSHISYSAGQIKNGYSNTGAVTVINILKAAELVIEENGQIIPSDQPKEKKIEANIPINSLLNTEKIVRTEQISNSLLPNIPIQIQIQIVCKPEDLDKIGDKINKLHLDISNFMITSSKERQ